MPVEDKPLPEFTKDELVDLGGWSLLKAATGLYEAGAVKTHSWEWPVLQGKVATGATEYFPRLTLRSLSFPENKCNCMEGRQGYMCEHTIALCIATREARKNPPEVEKVEIEKPVTEKIEVKSLKLSEARGHPLTFRIMVPPNIAVVGPRDAIMVKIEANVSGKNLSPENINRGLAYKLVEPHYTVAALIEKWCEGRLHGILQLKRAQLRELIQVCAGESCFYWINKPGHPISWQGDNLYGVSVHIEEPRKAKETQPILSKEIRVKAQPLDRKASFEKSGALSTDEDRSYKLKARTIVDGSENFLSISLPDRDDLTYHEILDLLKSNGFRLEPTNRKWWLRDRHKVLNFLSRYGDRFENKFRATFTPNFKKHTSKIKIATLVTEADELAGEFAVTVSLQAGKVTEVALRDAIASGLHYVEDQKNVYLLRPEVIQKLHEAEQRLSGQPDIALSPRLSLRVKSANLVDVEASLEGVSERFDTPESWKARSAALRSVANLQPAPLPPQLDETLRLYQRIGVAWLWHLYKNELGGILADEMGLGKTIQALALLQAIHDETQGQSCNLVVCPAGLLENWRREAARFVPELKVFVHHGYNRLGTSSEIPKVDLIVTSYGTLTRDAELFREYKFEAVIGDEAQHIKNRRSQNAASLRSLRAKGRFLLTGTPIENSLDDLRSLFDFLMPGYLAKMSGGLSTEEKSWINRRHSEQAAPYILRRGKDMVAPELPEKIEQVVYCELEKKQAALYQEYHLKTEKEIFEMEMAGASESKVRFAAFTQLLRLRQICADPRLLDDKLKASDSAKLAAFEEILEAAMDGGHRLLVFSQFVSVLQLVKSRLDALKVRYCYLDGSTKNRQAECDRFNENEDIPVFLISLKAGGVGLNLTGADKVVHFDPWWNPAIEEQATARAHRIGQKRVVTSIKLIATGTVEERVLELQRTKAHLLRDLLDDSAKETAKVSLADIKDLLKSGE